VRRRLVANKHLPCLRTSPDAVAVVRRHAIRADKSRERHDFYTIIEAKTVHRIARTDAAGITAMLRHEVDSTAGDPRKDTILVEADVPCTKVRIIGVDLDKESKSSSNVSERLKTVIPNR
jgi:hypothetical protein